MAATEAIRRSKHQHKGQCCDGPHAGMRHQPQRETARASISRSDNSLKFFMACDYPPDAVDRFENRRLNRPLARLENETPHLLDPGPPSSDYSICCSTMDQLRVETSSSIERRMTTCSIASLLRPAVVISARM